MQDLNLSWAESCVQHAATRSLLHGSAAVKVHSPWPSGLQTFHQLCVACPALASPYTAFVREGDCRVTANRSFLYSEDAGYLNSTASLRLTRCHIQGRSSIATLQRERLVCGCRSGTPLSPIMHARFFHLSKHTRSRTALV